MKIRIRTENKIFSFEVQEYTKVIELKERLASIIHLRLIFFVFEGKKLKDYKTLDSYGIEDGDVIEARAFDVIGGGPPIVNSTYSSNINCMDKRGKIGEEYCYNIKGSNEGTVWGDGIYTDDSNIAKAAVLEGKCKIGEEKLICIRIIEGKSSYGSCSKNGISSSSYGYWDGSYIFC